MILRSRNLIWLEKPLWKLPGGPTLYWSDSQNTPCDSLRCRYRVALELNLHTREAFFSSKRSTSFRFRCRVDLDSRIQNESSKRLHSIETGQSLIENTVEVTLSSLRGAHQGSRTFQLFELTVVPRWFQTQKQLWKPIVINASIELLPDSAEFLIPEGAQIPGWSLHPLKGDRVFLSQPMYFSNPDCGYDDICVPDLNVEIYDTSEGFEFGGDGPSTIYYKERISERNFTVAVRNLGENAFDAKVRVHIPAHFAYIPDKNYACKIESDPTEIEQVDRSETKSGITDGKELNSSNTPVSDFISPEAVLLA